MSKTKLVNEAIGDILKPRSEQDILDKLEGIRDELRDLSGHEVMSKLKSKTGYSNLNAGDLNDLLFYIIDDAQGEEQEYILAKLVEWFYEIM